MDAQFNIGKVLDDTARRDAVHFALAPLVAAERLSPGQHVGLTEEGGAGVSDDPLGIVDPFLPGPVFKGDRFWLFLYPNSITSLRHEWTHPGFDESVQELPQDSGKTASEAWLKEFCASADCPGYLSVMAMAERIADGDNPAFDDEYMHFDGMDAHGSIPDEFWNHVETVLGRPVKERPTAFSCSC